MLPRVAARRPEIAKAADDLIDRRAGVAGVGVGRKLLEGLDRLQQVRNLGIPLGGPGRRWREG